MANTRQAPPRFGPTGSAVGSARGPQGTQGVPGPPNTIEGPPGEDSYIPGPQGITGNTGLQGSPGVPYIGADNYDDPILIPGPQGNPGATGADGIIGRDGVSIPLAGDPGEDGWMGLLQGDRGPQGPAITCVDGAQGADVALAAGGAFSDLISISLIAGTWNLWGVINILNGTGGASHLYGKITDNSNNQLAYELQVVTQNSVYTTFVVQCFALVVSATATYKLRAASDGATTAKGTTSLGIGGGSKLHAELITGNATTDPSWVTYTPSWISSGTAPTIGNGSLTGRYKVFDANLVLVEIFWSRGSTSGNGTGTYQFTLPPGFPLYNDIIIPGVARMLINGVAHLVGCCSADPGGTATYLFFADNTNAGRNMIWQQTYPQAPATGDQIYVSYLYRYAA